MQIIHENSGNREQKEDEAAILRGNKAEKELLVSLKNMKRLELDILLSHFNRLMTMLNKL